MIGSKNNFTIWTKATGIILNSIWSKSDTIDKEIKTIEVEVKSTVRVEIVSLEQRMNAIEAKIKIIWSEVKNVEEDICNTAVKALSLDKNVKTVKKYIKHFEKRIKVIVTKTMGVEKRIVTVRDKLATASPERPYIKHHQFRVTR